MNESRLEQSLGDEGTQMNSPNRPAPEEVSLGDRATIGGTAGSLSDFASRGLVVPDSESSDPSSRYVTEARLGKGGMGEVILATDTRLDRKVAIKRILGDAARSQTAVQRFLTEAKSIAALNHYNIVQIYDFGNDKDGPYLIMEYVAGQSLQDRLRVGPLEAPAAIDLTCQLCDGLGKAHKTGIIHRDIKPANILLTLEGDPKLTDFGLAKQDTADHGQTMEGAILGTLDYMPPEQRRDSSKVDARSDLWSLAATLYVMLTGKSPKVIRLDQLPKPLQETMARALEEDPEKRFASASELKECLLAAKRSLTTVTTTQKLQIGECPSCGQQNEITNKFCTSCTASLQRKCLACKHDNRVWNTICPECGVRQADALASQQTKMDEALASSQTLEHDYHFESALNELSRIERVEHPDLTVRYQKLDEAQKRLVRLQLDWQSKQETAVFEAKSLSDQSRFGEALKLLRQIPIPIQSSELKSEAQRLEKQIAEINRLTLTIKQHVAERNYQPLQALLMELIRLNPRDKQAKAMLQKLLERGIKKEPSAAQPLLQHEPKPIVDNGEKYLYLNCGPLRDEELGPISRDQLTALFADGKIKRETLIRHPDSPQWTPLAARGDLLTEGAKKQQEAQQRKRLAASQAKKPNPIAKTPPRPLSTDELRTKLEGDFCRISSELESWFLLDADRSKATLTEWIAIVGMSLDVLNQLAETTQGLNQGFAHAMISSATLRRILPGMFQVSQQTKLTTDKNRIVGQTAGVALTLINPVVGLGLLAASSLGSEKVETTNWTAFHRCNSLIWRLSHDLLPVLPSNFRSFDLGKPEELLQFGKTYLQYDGPFGGNREETWLLDEVIVLAACRNASTTSGTREVVSHLIKTYSEAHQLALRTIYGGTAAYAGQIERAFTTSMARVQERVAGN